MASFTITVTLALHIFVENTLQVPGKEVDLLSLPAGPLAFSANSFLRVRAPGSSPASPLAQAFQDIRVQEGLRLFGTPEGTGRARRGYVQSSHLFGDSPDSEWASHGARTEAGTARRVCKEGLQFLAADPEQR